MSVDICEGGEEEEGLEVRERAGVARVQAKPKSSVALCPSSPLFPSLQPMSSSSAGPTSPTSSRTPRRHARSTAVVGGSAAGSTRGSVDGLTSSFGPARTTTIRPTSHSIGGLNPLLQPDVTADDLFVSYTPNEIATHLAAVKVQLQTHDSELKALINSRYQDVLAVGNTISAMKSSGTLLNDALDQVGRGLREGIAGGGMKEKNGSTGEDGAQSTESHVRHVAALLLVLHEGPEEIWRILDIVKAPPLKPAADDDAAGRVLLDAKASLRTARRLALASSLFEAVRIAGQELTAMRVPGKETDVRDVFPHPISTHTSTLSSLKVELQAALGGSIRQSSIALRSSTPSRIPASTLRASLEVAFRTTTVSLIALVKLGSLAAAEAEAYLLQSRKEALKQWALAAGTGSVDAADIMDIAHSGIVETASLHGRLFAAEQGVFRATLEQMAAAPESSNGSQQPPASSSSALLPPTPLASISTLPSADRILSTLSTASPLRSWRLEMANSPAVAGEGALNPWVDDVSKQLFASWLPKLIDSLPTVDSVGRVRHRLRSCVRRLRKVHDLNDDAASAASSTVSSMLNLVVQTTTTKLAARAVVLWRQDIQRWREEALHRINGALASAETDERERRLHKHAHEVDDNDDAALYGELFLIDSAHHALPSAVKANANGVAAAASTQKTAATTSKAHLQDLLEGKTMQVQAVLEPMRRGWVQLAETLQRYQDAIEEGEAADAELHSLVTLTTTQGWAPLLNALTTLFEERHSQEAQVMLLAKLVHALLTVPRYAKLLDAAAKRSEEVREAVKGLREKREAVLRETWKRKVVATAVTALLEGREEHGALDGGKAASPSLVRALALLEEASDEVLPPLGGAAQQQAGQEVGSIRDLLFDFHTEAERTSREASFAALASDLVILGDLVRRLGGSDETGPPATNRDLEAAFAPHALLLGRLAVALNASTGSKLGFASGQAGPLQPADEHEAPPSLLTLAPFKEGGRIASLEPAMVA